MWIYYIIIIKMNAYLLKIRIYFFYPYTNLIFEFYHSNIQETMHSSLTEKVILDSKTRYVVVKTD